MLSERLSLMFHLLTALIGSLPLLIISIFDDCYNCVGFSGVGFSNIGQTRLKFFQKIVITSALLLLWVCYAIERHFAKSLSPAETCPQSRLQQGSLCFYCVTQGHKKAAFLFFLFVNRETPCLCCIQFSFILSILYLILGLAGFRATYQGSFPQKQ